MALCGGSVSIMAVPVLTETGPAGVGRHAHAPAER